MIKLILVKDWSHFGNRTTNFIVNKYMSKFISLLHVDEWKRVQAIITPAFTSSKIKRMFNLINECGNRSVKEFSKLANLSEIINLKIRFGAYSLDVIASVAYAAKANTNEHETSKFATSAKDFLQFPIYRVLATLLLPSSLLEYFQFSIFKPEAMEYFVNMSKKLIEERKKSSTKYDDFLQMMIDVESTHINNDDFKDINEPNFTSETNEEIEANTKKVLKFSSREKKLLEDEIVAQSLLFLFAAYETTSTTLTSIFYLLAVHSNIQDKLYEECKKHFQSNDNISYEQLNNCDYLQAVISETLRYFPSASAAERETTSEYTFEHRNLHLEKGKLVWIPIYAIHYNPEFHPEPEIFRPERFLPENIHKIKPYTYLPFGAGPRNCIGMRLALTTIKTLTAKLILKYRFVRCEETIFPPQFEIYSVGLLQMKPTKIQIEKRN